MRWSIVILVLVIFGCNRRTYIPYNFLSDQNRKQPFQVLFADSAATRSGQLKPLDLPHLNDLIILRSGHVILVHNSGKFLEFKGDTSISVRKLDDSLKLLYNLEGHKLRPDISLLLSKKYHRDDVTDGIYMNNLFITNIGGLTIDITEPENFCLSWTAFGEKHSQYAVILTNVFAEKIDTIYSADTLLKINPLKYRDKLLVAKVFIPADSLYQSPYRAFKSSGKRKFLFPNRCDVVTPIEALESAYHLDTYFYLVDQAQNYFELAAALSAEPIYDELLANYKSRRGK